MKKKSKKVRKGKAKSLIFGGSYPTRGSMGKGGPYFITMPPQQSQSPPGLLEKMEANAALLERGLAVAEKYMKGPSMLVRAGRMVTQAAVPLVFHGFAARDTAAKEQATAKAKADFADFTSTAKESAKTTEAQSAAAFAGEQERAKQEIELAQERVQAEYAARKQAYKSAGELGVEQVKTRAARAIAAEKQKQTLEEKAGKFVGTAEIVSEGVQTFTGNIETIASNLLPNQYTSNLRGSTPDDLQVPPNLKSAPNITMQYNTSTDFNTETFTPPPKKSPEFVPQATKLQKLTESYETKQTTQVPPRYLTTIALMALGYSGAKVNYLLKG